RAIASPMPCAAPVTIATLSLSRMAPLHRSLNGSTRTATVVPAHSASKTRVNALMLGTHIPEPVIMGPRVRGADNGEISAGRPGDREPSRGGRGGRVGAGPLGRRMAARLAD